MMALPIMEHQSESAPDVDGIPAESVHQTYDAAEDRSAEDLLFSAPISGEQGSYIDGDPHQIDQVYMVKESDKVGNQGSEGYIINDQSDQIYMVKEGGTIGNQGSKGSVVDDAIYQSEKMHMVKESTKDCAHANSSNVSPPQESLIPLAHSKSELENDSYWVVLRKVGTPEEFPLFDDVDKTIDVFLTVPSESEAQAIFRERLSDEEQDALERAASEPWDRMCGPCTFGVQSGLELLDTVGNWMMYLFGYGSDGEDE